MIEHLCDLLVVFSICANKKRLQTSCDNRYKLFKFSIDILNHRLMHFFCTEQRLVSVGTKKMPGMVRNGQQGRLPGAVEIG